MTTPERHRCQWTIRRGRCALDDDPRVVEVSICCDGPDGCGATATATGVREILFLRTWLARNGAPPHWWLTEESAPPPEAEA